MPAIIERYVKGYLVTFRSSATILTLTMTRDGNPKLAEIRISILNAFSCVNNLIIVIDCYNYEPKFEFFFAYPAIQNLVFFI